VQKFARRDMLRRSVQIISAISLLPVTTARAKAGESCSDLSSESLRKSLHYADAAPNPEQSCSACGFFSPATDKPSCGNCVIMSDHVNPKGHCDSWSAKS
jgi:High potential iron-sulfur protein